MGIGSPLQGPLFGVIILNSRREHGRIAIFFTMIKFTEKVMSVLYSVLQTIIA